MRPRALLIVLVLAGALAWARGKSGKDLLPPCVLTARDGLRPHSVPAVAELRRAVAAAQKAASQP